jgi:hypothetical protein
MSAGVYDLNIDQGSDYTLDIALKTDNVATDLTNYSARAQIRPQKNSAELTASFTCTIEDPATEGKIKLELPNAVSKDIAAGTYYYDLEIYLPNDSFVKRVVQGKVKISQEVTR